jgi:hypothetical protein
MIKTKHNDKRLPMLILCRRRASSPVELLERSDAAVTASLPRYYGIPT